MRGAALVTILAVLVVMLAAVTLLPALLGFVGRRIDRLRIPGLRRRRRRRHAPAPCPVEPGGAAPPLAALAAGVIVLGVLALPFLGVRFGFPDAGNDRAGTTTRQAYDLLADGFGPGANGPLVLVADGVRGRLGRRCGARSPPPRASPRSRRRSPTRPATRR